MLLNTSTPETYIVKNSANHSLQRTAMDNEAKFPNATSKALKKLYMDKQLNSLKDQDVAFKTSQGVTTLI